MRTGEEKGTEKDREGGKSLIFAQLPKQNNCNALFTLKDNVFCYNP